MAGWFRDTEESEGNEANAENGGGSHDFVILAVLRASHAKVLADGILVGKKLVGEGLIDDGDEAGSGRVLVTDDAPAHQTVADGFKIMRADAIEGCKCPVIGRMALNVDSVR